LPLKIIIPITEWKEQYSVAPWMVRLTPDDLNGLTKISSADTLQLRSVSVERFVKKVGEINIEILEQIEDAISQVLDL
jgi:mRNA interferase MazF